MISTYFYCWWVEDVSFQSPLVGPCKHTQAELWNGLILKPKPDTSPKSQAQTGLELDIYFWSPIYAWKPNLPRELRYAQLLGNKKRCVQV